MKKPTKETAIKILELLKHGLVRGKGTPKPGEMCVEAAVCYAMGLPHSDEPPCVASAVRSFKIVLNDSNWSSDAARAKGLRRIAIAQLGSEDIDQALFVKELARLTIQKIVPIALRAAGKLHLIAHHELALENAAACCELDPTELNANAASAAADAAARAAANAAARAASAAADAANTAANAAARAASAAADAANTAANAANTAADAAADAAARAAANAANAANAAARDEVLTLMAEAGVEVLQLCKSPGCEWLGLIKDV